MSPLESQVLRDTGCSNHAQLETWQMARLRETITYARRESGFYRNILRGVDESELKTRQDLSVLPFTNSEQLRKYGAQWLCCPSSRVERVVTLKTSGTTAEPKRVFFTETDLERTIVFFEHGMTELIEKNDTVGILMPSAQSGSVGDLLSRALLRIPAAPVPLGPVSDIAQSYDAVRRAGCDCIVGIPVQVLALAEYGSRQPREQRAHLRSVLLSADTTPEALIRRVAELTGGEVFTHFGMTELGFGGAVECREHNGCHVRENDIIAEVVDQKTGRPIPDGQIGELVFTTLRREAMPFIRYRSGDMGRLITERCGCGSCLYRIQPVGGRLETRFSDISLWDVDERLFSCEGVVDHETRIEDGTLYVTAYGLSPLKPEALLAAIEGWNVKLECRIIKGFNSTGMQKRTVVRSTRGKA